MSIVTWEFESAPLAVFCGNSSVGRAQPCQGWGRGSESRFPLQHSEASVSEAFVVYARFVFFSAYYFCSLKYSLSGTSILLLSGRENTNCFFTLCSAIILTTNFIIII